MMSNFVSYFFRWGNKSSNEVDIPEVKIDERVWVTYKDEEE